MDLLNITHLGFLNIGPPEIILILVIAVLLFGGRLPEVARSVGKVFFDFKRNLRDLQNDIYTNDLSPPRSHPKPYTPEPETMEKEEAASPETDDESASPPEEEKKGESS